MPYLIKLQIQLSDEIVSKINKIVQYENLKNEIHAELNNEQSLTIENFIEGSVCKYVDMIGQIHQVNKSRGKLYNNIKEHLQDRNWTSKRLSDITKIDPGTLSNILSNKAQPSMEIFLKIWMALDCPEINTLFYKK